MGVKMNTDVHSAMGGKSNSIIHEIIKLIPANLVKSAKSIIVHTTIPQKTKDKE